MDTQNITPGPHMFNAGQYCTCMHIQSDIHQHNTTYITHEWGGRSFSFCEHACIYAFGIQRVKAVYHRE